MFIVVTSSGKAYNFLDSVDPETVVAAHGLTLADVTVYTNEEYAALAPAIAKALLKKKTRMVGRIKDHAATLMAVHVPAFASWDIVDFMATIWPMLDSAQEPADIAAARAIYSYGKTKVAQIKNATAEQIDAYDPTTDTNWPT